MIYEVDGAFTISSGSTWVPGVFATRGAAHYAFRFTDETLTMLQKQANDRAGGKGGVITIEDLRAARPKDTKR